MPTKTTTIPSRIARCADDGDSETYRISGEAIAHKDVTRGLERTRKVWLADHLRPAAATLEGAPITPLHSEQEVGEVTAAGWDPATESVVWEAEITDAKLAQQVADGDLEVSIEATHYDGGTHDATGAMVAADPRFTALSLVQRGSAPSASAEAGPAQSAALSARLSAAQIQATLADDEIDEEALAEELEAAIGPEHIFRNPNQAVGKAEELGLDDIHEHDVDGTPVYMPGESHDALLEYLQSKTDDAQAAETPAVEATLADGIPYEPTNVSPGDVDDWTDAEWDGDAVIADLPNPSEDDGAATVLDQTHAIVPADDEARESKANWKAPFRAGPDAAVNTRALVAIDGALSGARGGFDGLDDALEADLSDWTQSMLEAAPEESYGSIEDAEAAVGDDDWSADLRLFRVAAPVDDRDQFDDDILGVGVSFPDSDVYVDWNREAFPDELSHPHVSEYGSLSDLRKATGNDIIDVMPPAGALGHTADAEAAARDMMKAPAQGDIVTWNSQGERPAAGRVIETIQEGRYDTELSGDATVNAPAALIRLYRPSGDGEWGKTDVTVAHRTDTETLDVVDEWPAMARMQAAHLVDINGTEIDLTPPDYVVAAAQAGLDAKDEYDGLADCGTGVGEARARAIVTDDLAPSDFTGGENTAIPDYLNSHSEDAPATDDSPPEWDEDIWTDGCGPVQYALWGGTGDGRALEWFADKEAQLHDAMDSAEAAERPRGVRREPADAVNESTGTMAAESAVDSGDAPDSDAGADNATPPMSNDNTPDDPDDPSIATLKTELADVREEKSSLAEDLADVREERDELQTDVESLEADLAEKSDQIETAKEEYATALAETGETLLDVEDLTEKFSLAELAGKYDEAEQAALADAEADLEPSPQAGGGEGETATLSEPERERKQEIESRLADLDGRDGALAQAETERLESELAELTEA